MTGLAIVVSIQLAKEAANNGRWHAPVPQSKSKNNVMRACVRATSAEPATGPQACGLSQWRRDRAHKGQNCNWPTRGAFEAHQCIKGLANFCQEATKVLNAEALLL